MQLKTTLLWAKSPTRCGRSLENTRKPWSFSFDERLFPVRVVAQPFPAFFHQIAGSFAQFQIAFLHRRSILFSFGIEQLLKGLRQAGGRGALHTENVH